MLEGVVRQCVAVCDMRRAPIGGQNPRGVQRGTKKVDKKTSSPELGLASTALRADPDAKLEHTASDGAPSTGR